MMIDVAQIIEGQDVPRDTTVVLGFEGKMKSGHDVQWKIVHLA